MNRFMRFLLILAGYAAFAALVILAGNGVKLAAIAVAAIVGVVIIYACWLLSEAFN